MLALLFLTHLVTLLVEAGRHLQQRAALVQRSGEGLPLLLQLARDLLDLLGGVVTRLQQPVAHRHDAVDVHVHVLHSGTEGEMVEQRIVRDEAPDIEGEWNERKNLMWR